MAQKTTRCREECIDGELTIFFADFSKKLLREVYVRCPFCHPDPAGMTSQTVTPLSGEEQITLQMYYDYLAQGWQETDPV